MTTAPVQRPNMLLRVLVPAVLAVVGVIAVVATLNKGQRQASAPTSTAQIDPKTKSETPTQGPSTGVAQAPASQPAPTIDGAAPSVQPTEGQGVVAAATPQPDAGTVNGVVLPLRVRAVEGDESWDPLGSIDPSTGWTMRIEFSPNGAGVANLELAGLFEQPDRKTPVWLQRAQLATRVAPQAPGADGSLPATAPGVARELVPWAALELYAGVDRLARQSGAISAEALKLSEIDWQFDAARDETGTGYVVPPDLGRRRLWKQIGPGHFQCTIEDASGTEVLRIVRRYVLNPGEHELQLQQRIENLSPARFEVLLVHAGPIDMHADDLVYGGDKRRVRFGYLLAADPSRPSLDRFVVGDQYLIPRRGGEVAGRRTDGLWLGHRLWPNARSQDRGLRLAWFGLTSRYFGVAMMPLAASANAGKHLASIEAVDRFLLDPSLDPGESRALNPMLTRLVLQPRTLDPAGLAASATDYSVGLYAGPLDDAVIKANPTAADAGLRGLVVYNFGGMCGWCTFSWLTESLIHLLRALKQFLVFDWALAIVGLVVVVRTVLHPVTRWSQIRMQRFGKQMQELAPKQRAIQEKYGSDRKQMQAEMTRLWKEEGVNPLGMLGCLPIFLQTPVWIALYATLYFAYELRHQPALFGVFQKLTGGNWGFLADLAGQDAFVPFGFAVHIPLLSGLMGPISALNILPLILGVVYYFHNKYITPPTSAAMTPEQLTQQKVAKWMMVILFPLFMYNAPSGLAIYFVANSTIAIFENKFIRAHIAKHDLLNLQKSASVRRNRRSAMAGALASASGGTGQASRTSSGGGFMQRFRDALAEQRRAVEARRAQETKMMRQAGIDPKKLRDRGGGRGGSGEARRRFKDRG